MAISLHVFASDPDLERLLVHLDGFSHLPNSEKRYLCQRALHWLALADGFSYKVCRSQADVDLTIDGKSLLLESPVGTHSQPPKQTPTNPDLMKPSS